MYQTHLKKVGGSVILILPPAVLRVLNLEAGKEVVLNVHEGKLLMDPKPKPVYQLAELLEQHQVINTGNGEWLDNQAIGKEKL
ncbi:MAG: antitoxin [Acinetobacter sp.]